jgi:hypothetical protein
MVWGIKQPVIRKSTVIFQSVIAIHPAPIVKMNIQLQGTTEALDQLDRTSVSRLPGVTGMNGRVNQKTSSQCIDDALALGARTKTWYLSRHHLINAWETAQTNA